MAIALLGLLAFVTAAALSDLPPPGQEEAFHDWDQNTMWSEVAARSVTEFGEKPYWNPYTCGGLPLLAHPAARVFGPFFLLQLILPIQAALRLEIALHLYIAALGMALLAHRHAKSVKGVEASAVAAGTAVGGLIFAGSTYYSLHLAEGHLWILAAAYIPWVVYCFERGLERPIFAIFGGGLLTLMLLEGGIYPLPCVASFLGLYALGLAALNRSLRPLAILGLVMAPFVLFSGPKLLPLLEFIKRRPRLVGSTEWIPLRGIATALLGRDQALERPFDWRYWGFHEQGNYIGVLALVLAMLGALLGRGVTRVVACLFGLFLAVSAGSFAPWAPWSLMHKLPLFSSLHVPSRFLLLVVLCTALLASRGLASVLTRFKGRRLTLAATLLVPLALAADMYTVRSGILGAIRCPMKPWPEGAVVGAPLLTVRVAPLTAYGGEKRDHFFHTKDPCRSAMTPASRAGIALLDAYDELCPEVFVRPIGRGPKVGAYTEPTYRGEVWVKQGTGSVEVVARSHNTLTLRVDLATDALVSTTQNWDGGWSTNRGQVVNDAGRLALRANSGAGVYTLSYTPPGMTLGWIMCGVGLALTAIVAVRDRKTGRVRNVG